MVKTGNDAARKPRPLQSKFKLTSRTIPVVYNRIAEFRRLAAIDHERTFETSGKRRKIGIEHIIPIMILHWTDRPEAEQMGLYDKYAPLYEELMRRWQYAEGEPADEPAPAPIPPASVRRKGKPPGGNPGR